MSAYAIDVYPFEFWDGPVPPIPTQKVTPVHRPGMSDVAFQKLGVWGDTFSVRLRAHCSSQYVAVQAHKALVALIGAGGKQVTYNNINWSSTHSTIYHVIDIELLSIQNVPRLMGPGYDYPGGAILEIKATITPQRV